jgi:hypothetical protein
LKKRNAKNVQPEDAIIDEYGEIVGAWNGKSIKRLSKEINRALGKYDCMLTLHEMPHREQIPGDISYITDNYECDIAIWGCDVKGNCIVSSCAEGDDWIAHINEIRCYLINEYGFRLDIVHPMDITHPDNALHVTDMVEV